MLLVNVQAISKNAALHENVIAIVGKCADTNVIRPRIMPVSACGVVRAEEHPSSIPHRRAVKGKHLELVGSSHPRIGTRVRDGDRLLVVESRGEVGC
ncbi:hypothetical protein D3C72_1440070 [compost metagenome]